MSEKINENDEIIVFEKGFEEYDEFDGYEEPAEKEAVDEYDEFDGYEEAAETETAEETDEFDGYEEADEPEDSEEYDEFDGYEEPKKPSKYAEFVKQLNEQETEKKSAWPLVSFLSAGLVLVAAVVLLLTVGKSNLSKLKILAAGSNTDTLASVGLELEDVELLGGDKVEQILEAQKLRVEEARKRELEEAFNFDEVDSQKEPVKVSLSLTSILKDIKIKIVNDNNKLIANIPFEVEVKTPSGEVKQYTDENEDGIIYIDGLAGGDYSVKTLSVKGYEGRFSFADKADLINVKEKIEYKKVDVSNEVKKEDESNKKEDPESKKPQKPQEDSPAQPGQGEVSENNPGQEPVGAVFGIDVSKWNGDIDWSAVASSGVKYAIIRCGFRGSTEGGLIEDPKFYDNVRGANANGIKVGVYFFSQAVNEIEAVEEASMVLDMIAGYNISYPVFLDVESSGGGRGDQIGVSQRTEVCKAFAQTIRSAGYVPGIYSNKTWFEERMNTTELTGYKIWLAQYTQAVTYTRTSYDLWQYSDSGKVYGIPTGVDLNISYLGY